METQTALFEPESSWKPPSLSDLPDDWGNGRVGIDTETRDDSLRSLGPGVRRGGYIVGVSVAIEDGPCFYLPYRHEGGGNLDADQVRNYLRSMSKKFSGTICGANLQYDLDYLSEEGMDFPKASAFRDVQVADPLIDEHHKNYTLEGVAERWGFPGKDESILTEALSNHGFAGAHAKGGIWSLHSKFVGAYAEQDARLPLNILRRQEREIENQDLWRVYNLESQLLPVLVRMRRRGVAVSIDRLEQVENWARQQQTEAIEAANRLTTRRLDFDDITKVSALASVLKEVGIPLPQTATGKDSVTAGLLESLEHPIGEHLRRAKKMSTLRSTFCDGVRKHLTNGRLHCTFNQLRRQKDDGSGGLEGAAYGRLSASHPNLQNQPARDEEIGPMWRSIYIPDGGGVWASLDYSQQEPRQAVHFAIEAGAELIGKEAWEKACEAARRYETDPSMDFHQMMADIAGIPRKPAKVIFLGLCYGMGGAKLCLALGLPTGWILFWKDGHETHYKRFDTKKEAIERAEAGRAAGFNTRYWEGAGEEGQKMIDTFNQRVPFVSRTANYCQSLVKRQGFIETLSGRRCRFPAKDGGGYDWIHKAFNRRIQGSSGDQAKEAVIEMDRQGIPLQIQVHDEVDYTAESRESAVEASKIMENVVKLRVPMKVDVECGPSWGEAA